MEFAFGLHPREGSTAPVTAGLGLPIFKVIEDGGSFYEQLEYPGRRSGAQFDPLIYLPQFTTNLSLEWVGTGVVVSRSNFPTEQASLNALWEKISARRPVGGSVPQRGFARVVLE